jgi:branched-chain amino acid transport system ATP-binding protein
MEEKGDLMFSIQDIRDDLGITVLLVEHDMNLIMDVSDRILALNFGERIAEGLPEEIQKHPEVLKAYLGEEAGREAIKRLPDYARLTLELSLPREVEV